MIEGEYILTRRDNQLHQGSLVQFRKKIIYNNIFVFGERVA